MPTYQFQLPDGRTVAAILPAKIVKVQTPETLEKIREIVNIGSDPNLSAEQRCEKIEMIVGRSHSKNQTE